MNVNMHAAADMCWPRVPLAIFEAANAQALGWRIWSPGPWPSSSSNLGYPENQSCLKDRTMDQGPAGPGTKKGTENNWENARGLNANY